MTPIRAGGSEVADATGVQKLVTVSRDITEQKRAEQERALLLASERAARSEAERAARMKDDFVGTLSHELRTPLNAILGWVGVLKQHAAVAPTRWPRRSTSSIATRARQSQMIDDLLDMSRIISGQAAPRRAARSTSPRRVAGGSMASARRRPTPRACASVKVLGSAAIIQGDPGRLQQVRLEPAARTPSSSRRAADACR